jgi:hypothetical protein
MVWFGCCWELATVLALISVSSPGALFCFSAISFGPFSVICFASSLAEVSLLGPAKLDCPLIHQQKIQLRVPTACTAD